MVFVHFPLPAKIPELEDAVENKKALLASMKDGPTDDCKGVCTAGEIKEAEADLQTVQNGLSGWNRAMKIDKEKETVSDWFVSDIEPLPIADDKMWEVLFEGKERTGNPFGGIPLPGTDTQESSYLQKAGALPKAIYEAFNDKKGKLSISDQSSGLAPQTLINDAKSLGFTYGTSSKTKSLDETRRIQFSGASGTYEMSMSKARVESYSANSCYLGCNFETNLGLGVDIQGTMTAFGIGFSGALTAGEFIM